MVKPFKTALKTFIAAMFGLFIIVKARELISHTRKDDSNEESK